MKKIIIDAKDYRAVEVAVNDSFGPRMGMTSLSYNRLVAEEKEILRKLTSMLQKKELPRVVTILPEICSKFETDSARQKIGETMDVINKAVVLLTDGFHVAVVNSILSVTCGGSGGFGVVFDSRFAPLREADCRKDFWGTCWKLPCLITKGLLEDLMNYVDVDNPTAEDLRRSKVIEAIKTYQYAQEL